MRVLQINLAYYYGGSTGKIVDGLAKAMIQDGIQPFILYGVNRGEQEVNYAQLVERRTIKRFNELCSRMRGNHGFNNIASTKKACKIIAELRPDIIHLHNLHGSFINVEILFSYIKSLKIPVVWTLHDCWAFTGRCAYYDYNSCGRWKKGCGCCSFKKQYPSTWFFDKSKENFIRKEKAFNGIQKMLITVPSRWLAKELESSLLKKYPKSIVNNGIDLTIFKPSPSSIKSDYNIERLCLAVSFMWSKQKGFEYIIKIANSLPEPWKLVVVGVNDSQKKVVEKAGAIAVEKIIDGNELAKWYSAADVFINPTLEDNFPTVNIEAIACGTPCVTFDAGGSSEIINDNVGGKVEKHDWKSLVDLAISMDKQKMTTNCVKEAIEKYDVQLMYQKYLGIYKRMLELDC